MFYMIVGVAMRIIFHSDLNNFYASVECLYNPSIRNDAVVVVGDAEKRHGIVLAKNGLAKKYGIKTGDTIWEAQQKCPTKLTKVVARFDLYRKVSKIVKDIYREYSDRVESFGIDEAWIDVSERVSNFEDAYNLAEEIRKRIITEVGLTVSIGVSFNKIFAKLGSDLKKPNAVSVITPTNFKQVVWPLKCEDLLMVGHSTKAKLIKNNIKTIGDIARAGKNFLKQILGKNGEKLFDFATGKECSEVQKVGQHDEIKSIGNSTTCARNLTNINEVRAVLYVLAESVANRMREVNLWASCVAVSFKTEQLETFERQQKLDYPTNLAEVIGHVALDLFKCNYNWEYQIRSLGVRVLNLCDEPLQYNIFNDAQTILKKDKLERIVDSLRGRFGYGVIRRACILKDDMLVDLNPQDASHKIHPKSFIY